MKRFLILLLLAAGPSTADQGAFELAVDFSSGYSSNVFLDRSLEWDISLRPSLEASLDFGEFWSAGYSGELNAYTRHDQLLSHWHELFIFLNPAWGEEGENEFVLEASLQTLRNQPEFSALNLLQPGLLAKLILEPKDWLRWRLSAQGIYRYFYDDNFSSSIDGWLESELSFTLPFRATISPRAGIRGRYLPRITVGQSGQGADRFDFQAAGGAHYSQSLGKACGLQLDYLYLVTVGKNSLLERQLTQVQFTYLGEEFLFGGHQVFGAVKVLLGKLGAISAGGRYEWRQYAGWPALDEQGALIGADRRDQRLGPRVAFDLHWEPKKSQSHLPEITLSASYQYLRQWSNHWWYDTSLHQAALLLAGSW